MNNQNPPIEKIDFFGADLDNEKEMHHDDNNDIMSPNDFDQLEKDFVQDDPQSNNNPFGQSITKEILQQSKKEVAADLGDPFNKKNLEIEIDDNEDYNTQNEKAQQNLNDQLQKMEEQ